MNKNNENVVWQNLCGNESNKLVRFKSNRVVRIIAVKLWLQIQVRQHKSFIIFVAYRPPDSEVTCIREELKPICIEALLKGKQVVVMSDLNCNLLNPSCLEDKVLIDTCSELKITQLVKVPL